MDNDMKIMKFLGYKTHNHKTLNTLQWDCPKDTPLENILKGKLYFTKLHFQDDWNWIYEVVDYIENIKTDGIINVELNSRGNSITIRVDYKGGPDDYFLRASKPIFTVYDKNRKMVYYKAIIEFINWYNKYTK